MSTKITRTFMLLKQTLEKGRMVTHFLVCFQQMSLTLPGNDHLDPKETVARYIYIYDGVVHRRPRNIPYLLQ